MKRPEDAEILAVLTPQERKIHDLIVDAFEKLDAARRGLREIIEGLPKLSNSQEYMAYLLRFKTLVEAEKYVDAACWVMPELALLRMGNTQDICIGYDVDANEVFRAME